MDLVWLRMLSLFSKEMLAYYIRCFMNVLVLILGCVPPPVTKHALLSASTFYTFTQHIKVASWVKGGNRDNQTKMVRNAEKFLYNL